MFTCEYCHHTFTTTSNLYYHQRTNKECLLSRGCALPTKPTCTYCKEPYSSLQRLHAHEVRCQKRPTPEEEKVALIIAQKDEEIARLRSELADSKEEIARQRDQIIGILQQEVSNITQIASKRSKVTHKTIYNQSQISNHTNNHLDLSNTEHIHSQLEKHLDHETVAQGQVGIAKMVVKHILTTENGELLYVCTDQDRHIFRYLNEEGQAVKDIRAGHLKEALHRSGIGRMAVKRGEEMWTKEDGSVDIDNMMAYHPRVIEIGTLNNEEHDHRFRNELARLTTVPCDKSPIPQ